MSSYLKRLRSERRSINISVAPNTLNLGKDCTSSRSSSIKGEFVIKLTENEEKIDEAAAVVRSIKLGNSQEPQYQHLLPKQAMLISMQPAKLVSSNKNINNSAHQNAPTQLKYLQLPLLLLYSLAIILLLMSSAAAAAESSLLQKKVEATVLPLLAPSNYSSTLQRLEPRSDSTSMSTSKGRVRTEAATAAGLMRGLIQQLVAADYSDRWTSLPSLQSQIGVRNPPLSGPIVGNRGGPLSGSNRPVRPMATRLALNRALSRLRNRIGARNSIRVHNAFRDIAWRLLSSFSMPTPIIYEIRRQHLYSFEDDTLNDSLYNKNTTKTVRSRRHLEIAQPPNSSERVDHEHDSFTNRARIKLENLLSLERLRRNFGRVAKFPSALFSSFKRQQQDIGTGSINGEKEQQDDYIAAATRTATIKPETSSEDNSNHLHHDETDDNDAGSGDDDKAQATPSTGKGKRMRKLGSLSKRLLQRYSRKKDPDRQMIYINGKQYYVNDEGQLKEFHENAE